MMLDSSHLGGSHESRSRPACSSCVVEGLRDSVTCTTSAVADAPLAVMLLSSDGGAFASDYAACNVLRDDKRVYCSQTAEGVNLIVRASSRALPSHDPYAGPSPSPSSSAADAGAPFSLTSLVLRVPASGFTSPLGQAIIFTSWDYPDLAAIQDFDSVCNQHDFERLAAAYGSCSSSGTAAAWQQQQQQQQGSSAPPSPLSSMGSQRSSEDLCQPTGAGRGGTVPYISPYVSGMAAAGQYGYGGQHAWAGVGAVSPPSPPSWLADAVPASPAGPTVTAVPSYKELGAEAAASASLAWSHAASRPVPRVFVDMGSAHEVVAVLPSPASGRYVVVKMLRAKYSHADNIDVQYVGLRGWAAPPCFGSGIML